MKFSGGCWRLPRKSTSRSAKAQQADRSGNRSDLGCDAGAASDATATARVRPRTARPARALARLPTAATAAGATRPGSAHTGHLGTDRHNEDGLPDRAGMCAGARFDQATAARAAAGNRTAPGRCGARHDRRLRPALGRPFALVFRQLLLGLLECPYRRVRLFPPQQALAWALRPDQEAPSCRYIMTGEIGLIR